MNIRIQTYSKISPLENKPVESNPSCAEGTAVDALKKGLTDLQDVCDVVADQFWEKRQAFNAEHGLGR